MVLYARERGGKVNALPMNQQRKRQNGAPCMHACAITDRNLHVHVTFMPISAYKFRHTKGWKIEHPAPEFIRERGGKVNTLPLMMNLNTFIIGTLSRQHGRRTERAEIGGSC